MGVGGSGRYSGRNGWEEEGEGGEIGGDVGEKKTPEYLVAYGCSVGCIFFLFSVNIFILRNKQKIL